MSVHTPENSIAGEKLHHPLIYLAITFPILGKYLPGSINVLSFHFSLTRLGAIFLAALGLVAVINREKVTLTYQDMGILLILITFIASVSWSITPTGSWIAANNSLFHVIYFAAVIIFLNSERDLTAFAYYLSFTIFAIAIIGMIALLPGISSRYVVGGVTYNSFSRDLVALFPVAVLMALTFRKNRLLNIFSAGMIGLLIPLSGSRSGVVGLALAIILLLVFYAVYLSELSAISTAFMAISIPIIGALLLRVAISTGVFGQRLLRIPLTLRELFSPDVLGSRYTIYQIQADVIPDNWLYGIGYAAFFNEYGYGAHNPLSRILLATGILPALLFVTIYYQSAKHYLAAFAERENPLIIGFIIGLLGLTASGFFNILLNEPIFYLYFAVGSHTCARIINDQ